MRLEILNVLAGSLDQNSPLGVTVFHIHFRYGKYDGRRQTRCEIHSDECLDARFDTECCGVIVKGVAFAHCAYEDQFVKSKGRKIALARAMTALDLPRNVRTLIWELYLTATNTAIR